MQAPVIASWIVPNWNVGIGRNHTMLEAKPSVFRPDALGAFGARQDLFVMTWMPSVTEGKDKGEAEMRIRTLRSPGDGKRMRRPHAHGLLIYRPSSMDQVVSPKRT